MTALNDLSQFGLSAAETYVDAVRVIDALTRKSSPVLEMAATKLRERGRAATDQMVAFRYAMLADLLEEEVLRRRDDEDAVPQHDGDVDF